MLLEVALLRTIAETGAMAGILETAKRLFPKGTHPKADGLTDQCPPWPPDLFAFAATLLQLSSCYAYTAFTAPWEAEYLFTKDYLDDVSRLAMEWSNTGAPSAKLQELWTDLLKNGENELDSQSLPVAIRLMAIADEAAAGMGFAPNPKHRGAFSRLVLEELKVAEEALPAKDSATDVDVKTEQRLLPYIPVSLCQMVRDDVACVQPKTNTPTVGCTLRSLSHNLALLPPSGVVETRWLFAHPNEHEHKPFNLLLVPYPFVINANDFVACGDTVDEKNRFFCYRAGWFHVSGKPVKSAEIAKVICSLITAAKRETREIHGVVLPETAMLESQASEVAQELARLNPEMELFISGTIDSGDGSVSPRNSAYTARLHRGEVWRAWSQSKHHRWCLDGGQIVRYHLGSVLDPVVRWWEKIDVSDRTCVFTVIRRGASLAVLVCEDLARFDPVLPVINAVGPNLVVALLMDGPQLERRWPGRYASVLADDPGSSVLTLTCLGMIRRSSMPGDTDQREIALWKQGGDVARELKLPSDAHALLLSLTTTGEEQVTLDRRTDGGATRRFRLSGARPVKFDGSVPSWLKL
jgi:hypothetical protein